MKTKQFTLKAFTARTHMSELSSVMQICILRYHHVTLSLSVGVKASARPPFLPHISLWFRGFLIKPTEQKCLNGEYS